MKDLMRMRTSLNEEIEAILNDQIRIEASSSSKYLAMASWCDRNGFDNSAEFFYKQSAEERGHMLKIFKYVCDMGGKAVSPEIMNIPQDFNSFREVFETALEQEIGVTQAINRIVSLCRKVNDYTTETLMHWFLQEQMEEEYVARRILELFEIIGEEGVGTFMIDENVPKVTYKPA